MKNILLVFGGKSYEHDISVVTASQIYNKTKSENYNLIPIYISKENLMLVYLNKEFNLSDFANHNFKLKNKNFKEIVFVSSEKNKLFQKTKFGLKEYLHVENAIIACHGGNGENGRLVSFFEDLGIKCSAGNVDSLAVCMNKYLFKQTMKGMNVPVVSGFKIYKNDFNNEDLRKNLLLRIRFYRFPIVIKPNNGGSSIGLFIAKNVDEFIKSVNECFEFDDEVVVEKFISGAREFNVAVLGSRDSFEISEIDEPLKINEVLSFDDKYLSGDKSGKKQSFGKSMAGQKRKFPADISERLKEKITTISAKIFKSLRLVGVVRIDYLYDEKTDNLYVCEVNSIPGSLAFYFFAQNKITTNYLVDKLVKISESKDNEKSEFNNEFVTNILN